MRAGFGLVAVMITIALMIWLWAQMTSETAKQGVPAKNQAAQIAGYDEQGRPAMNSIQLVAEVKNGKLEYMLVDSINPEGAMAKVIHLQVNDAIVGAGPLNFKDYGYDEEMARALILTEYQQGKSR